MLLEYDPKVVTGAVTCAADILVKVSAAGFQQPGEQQLGLSPRCARQGLQKGAPSTVARGHRPTSASPEGPGGGSPAKLAATFYCCDRRACEGGHSPACGLEMLPVRKADCIYEMQHQTR